MNWRETLPWNWGKKEIPVKREGESQPAPVSPGIPDLFELLRSSSFGAGAGWPAFPRLGEAFGFESDGFLPALDAKETEDRIEITVELPGLEEKDIEIGLCDDLLTIKGEKRNETRHGEGDAQWVERRYGSFRRAIPLPADIDPDGIKAHFQSGVLQVVAPRTGEPAQQHHRIPIQTS